MNVNLVQHFKSFHNLANRWKLNTDNKLINKLGDWKYQEFQWSIPPECYLTKPGGLVGYIEVINSMFDSNFESSEKNVLSCFGNFDVILDTKEGIHMRDELWTNQKWKCGMPDEDGWFLIQHPGTGKFLTNKGSGQLKVEGNFKLNGLGHGGLEF